jgi:NADP-dependent 3-hydroxy acid dehydrogenase YdfG
MPQGIEGSNPSPSAMQNRIFIVTGASGKLGKAFISQLESEGEQVIALSRREADLQGGTYQVDLLDEHKIEEVISKIDFSGREELCLIHAVGGFKFEKNSTDIKDADQDGIDDDVYATNVLTLKNILKSLLNHRPGVIKVCAFASVSDRHNIPFWASYTRAKNIMRGYLKELCESGRIQALIVNVSTVDTGNENHLRPHADKTYWLQPQEIALKTIPELISLSPYKEIDVYKEKPDFDPEYYLDHEAILKKWEEEMGIS